MAVSRPILSYASPGLGPNTRSSDIMHLAIADERRELTVSEYSPIKFYIYYNQHLIGFLNSFTMCMRHANPPLNTNTDAI